MFGIVVITGQGGNDHARTGKYISTKESVSQEEESGKRRDDKIRKIQIYRVEKEKLISDEVPPGNVPERSVRHNNIIK